MRPLHAIVDQVLDGGTPSVEELKYVITAFDKLIAKSLESGYRATQLDVQPGDWFPHFFRAVEAVYAVDPKVTTGWESDPANPDYQARREFDRPTSRKTRH